MSLDETMQTTDELNLTGENPLSIDEWDVPSTIMDLAGYWKTIGNQHRDSVSGTVAWKAGLWFGDQFHRYDARDFFSQFEFTMKHSNARINGEPIQEVVNGMRQQFYEETMAHLGEMARPDPDLVAEWADLNVKYILRDSWFKAGKIENEVKLAIEREFDEEVLAISRRYDDGEHETAISEVTEWERPEARGIDLYLPESGIGIQVKTGDGGDWHKSRDEIEADYVARVDYKEEYLPKIKITPVKK